MKTLVLATALVAIVSAPATAQTTMTACQTTTNAMYCSTTTLPPPYKVPSSLTPSQQAAAYGKSFGGELQSSLTPSQQVTAYGARY